MHGRSMEPRRGNSPLRKGKACLTACGDRLHWFFRLEPRGGDVYTAQVPRNLLREDLLTPQSVASSSTYRDRQQRQDPYVPQATSPLNRCSPLLSATIFTAAESDRTPVFLTQAVGPASRQRRISSRSVGRD